jgi:HSP20 family protein
MSIIKRNGTHGYPGFFNDFLTKDLWNNWDTDNNSLTGTTIPGVNIRENNENFTLEMAAPGMNKEDFKIELHGNSLTITSEKDTQDEEKGRGTLYKERI